MAAAVTRTTAATRRISAEAAASNYGDLHRAFLQAMMLRGCVGLSELLKMFVEILQEYEFTHNPGDREELKRLVGRVIFKINREIRELGLDIRRCLDERTGKFSYILINTIASEHTVSAFSDFTANEMVYFKTMLTAMFEEEDRALSHRHCLNLTTTLEKKMTMEQGEDCLNRMIAEKWLEKGPDGKIRLHVRAIHELEPYLKKVFNLQDCEICKCIVLAPKNQQCAECDSQAHQFCVSKQPRRICPNEECRTPWPEIDLNMPVSQASTESTGSQVASVAPKRVQMADDSESDRESTVQSASASLRRVHIADDSSDQEMSEGEGTSAGTGCKRRKAATFDADMD